MLNDSTCLCHEGIGSVDATGNVSRVNLRIWFGRVMRRQTIDLICIEDCVGAQMRYRPECVLAGHGIFLGSLDRLGINDGGAAFALADLSAEGLGLAIGHPRR